MCNRIFRTGNHAPDDHIMFIIVIISYNITITMFMLITNTIIIIISADVMSMSMVVMVTSWNLAKMIILSDSIWSWPMIILSENILNC